MTTTESLKELERRAYRATFEDGVYDILFGLVFLILAGIPILETMGISRFPGYFLFLIPILVLWLGKRHITIPRLGFVEFGPKRKSKRRVLAWVFGVVLVLTLPLMIIMLRQGLPGNQVWFIVALFAAPLLAVAIFAVDCPRLYIYAALLAATVAESEFLTSYVGTPFNALISFGIPGTAIIIYGISLLITFIKKYPLPAQEVPHVS